MGEWEEAGRDPERWTAEAEGGTESGEIAADVELWPGGHEGKHRLQHRAVGKEAQLQLQVRARAQDPQVGSNCGTAR